jgi:hypothetical protein
MLKDAVDRMDVVEDAKHDRRVLIGEPTKLSAHHLQESAIRPLFVANQPEVRLRDHASVSLLG